MKLKKVIKKIWIGVLAKRMLYKQPKKKAFPGSKKYWEQRYLSNRTSGSGSYGRLAIFKAEMLNDFVNQNKLKTILELGCGDGNQLEIANYPHYFGYDVSNRAIEICKEKFKNDTTKEFQVLLDNTIINQAELALSLDVIYHLIEDDVFNSYMNQLFNNATKFVIIYSSNYNDHFAEHVKCRKFTDWIGNNVSDKWELLKFINNKYPFDKNKPDNTSMADFYIYKKKQ